jgi:3(or 17)beta-hydroxysteroid dehydrogenase
MGRVAGKVAIVTGAASGIGRETARLLAAEGSQVVLTDINDAVGETAAQETGHGAVFMAHDISREDNWLSVISATLRNYGRLDILVNNAAISSGSSPLLDPEHTTVEAWMTIHRVNSLGPFLGCKHAIPAMRDSGGGSIINVSSAGALVPSPMNTPYGAAKAGLVNLTITVAIHCAVKGYGIRCNAVYPGATRTAMLEGLFVTLAAETRVTPEEVAEQFAGQLPLGRLATPREIANAILFLASDESSYVNADHLVVDGGARYPTLLARK